jgi:hypothetical protein
MARSQVFNETNNFEAAITLPAVVEQTELVGRGGAR